MSNIIIYGSHYGTTKQYAEELSRRTNIKSIPYGEINQINNYDSIIYLGGLYAGGVLGMSKTLKKLDNINTDEIVAEIKKTGRVTRSQYRAITGACSFGTNKFCEQHNIQDLEEISLDELRKILVDDYGAKRFWKLIDED